MRRTFVALRRARRSLDASRGPLAGLLAAACAALLTAAAPAGAITFTGSSVALPGSGIGSPSGLDVGDIDGDGDADIAVSLQSGDLSILLRDAATGTYAHAPSSPRAIGASDAGPLEIADVDRDGHDDVVAFQSRALGSTAAVLLGDGAGGFAPTSTVTLPGNYGSMALADVNGDSSLDLVTPLESPSGARLVVRLGAGDGTFAAPVGAGVPLDGPVPSAIAVADFDGDRAIDAAVGNLFVRPGLVTVLRGDGAGGFASVGRSPFDIGSSTFSLSAGDLDGDGRTDLAAPVIPQGGDARSSTPGVLLGNGDGTFRAGPAGSFVSPPGPNQMAAFALPLGDLDGDGRLDAALPIGEDGGVWPLFGDGAGRLLPSALAPLPAGSLLNAGAIADLDGDGRLDVVATSAVAPSRLRLFVNDAEQAIDVAPSAVDLGSVQVGGAAATATIRVANPGDHGLRLAALTVSGADAEGFAAGGCLGGPIPAGGHCDVTVSFAPTAAGARTATLEIASDAPGAQLTTVTLTGTGTLPPDGGGGDGGGGGGGDGGGGGGGIGGGGIGGGGGGTGGGGTGGGGGGDGSGGSSGRGGSGRGGSTGGGSGAGGRTASLKLTVRPARATLAPGGRLRLAVTVRNSGRRALRSVTLCPRGTARQLVASRCARLGKLAPGRTARRTVTVRLARTARRARTYTLTITARAPSTRPANARTIIRAR